MLWRPGVEWVARHRIGARFAWRSVPTRFLKLAGSDVPPQETPEATAQTWSTVEDTTSGSRPPQAAREDTPPDLSVVDSAKRSQYIHIYIYIYIERERDLYIYIYVYIYIYIYICVYI